MAPLWNQFKINEGTRKNRGSVDHFITMKAAKSEMSEGGGEVVKKASGTKI